MTTRLLIVVDMLIGFCEPDHPLYCGATSREIIPRIVSHIESHYQDDTNPILFLVDTHKPNDPEFEMFPPHCIEGTEECLVVPELMPYVTDDNLIPKSRYSGFFRTDLESRIQEIDPTCVEVCGVCTQICVFFTVEELRNRFYPTRVLSDLVASFDPQAHLHALSQMEQVLGAEIV
ncbi:MAG: isochorismatase family cysteine hydrolase [Planctomycetota bacterium]|jgi:nicotinamidase/pyrazinamidase|nr:isochorismatase family cysteine hydrolase [Planctomycetota bacterium]